MRIGLLFSLLGCLLLCSCSKEKKLLKAEKNEHLSGGGATTYDTGPNAFTHPIEQLKGLDELNFFVGNSFFNQNWVASPSSTTARDGLGPNFNKRSCSGCHFKDGRGQPPVFDGEPSKGIILRLSIPGSTEYGSNLPEPTYGHQLQDQAIPGMMHEGKISITYEMIQGRYPDGTSYELQKPIYSVYDLKYGDMHTATQTSPRIANQIIGLGLLEAIEEHHILENEDELDANGDGISGKANWVWNLLEDEIQLGRFGWKAGQPNLLQQTAAAFIGDLGITNTLFTEQNCSESQKDCIEAHDSGSLEIEFDDLKKTADYCATTAVPVRRNYKDQEVLKGKEIFKNLGCNSCHIETFTTGNHLITALTNQVIFPYTDLLLHDMGEGLSDHRPEFLANGNEWRTPPLWGIGLFEIVNNHTNYIHDGRARNLEEAILWHGGEAQKSKNEFKALTKDERYQLIQFLKSL
jgi:CxxC motif-containing protein (DUF1111 family)